MSHQLRILKPRPDGSRPGRDLAGGWNVVLFWVGPVAWIEGSSAAGPLLHLSFDELGILLVVGTVWFGGLCLLNARRCGRTHCRIDGILLPALALVGLLSLMSVLRLSWGDYVIGLWGIVGASFVVECAVGSYPPSRSIPAVR